MRNVLMIAALALVTLTGCFFPSADVAKVLPRIEGALSQITDASEKGWCNGKADLCDRALASKGSCQRMLSRFKRGEYNDYLDLVVSYAVECEAYARQLNENRE